MARSIATTTTVERAELLDFVRPRHRLLLATARRDGRPQISPVSGGVDFQGRIVISTYPAGRKPTTPKTTPGFRCSSSPMTGTGPWVQVDGDAEVLHMPEAADGLVDYFRCISGEHPTGTSIAKPCTSRNKSLIRITPTRCGPIATGGFPANALTGTAVAARLDA